MIRDWFFGRFRRPRRTEGRGRSPLAVSSPNPGMMTAFHSVFPELAQQEVRCIHILPDDKAVPDPNCPDNQYQCVEYYCADLSCDCRMAFIVIMHARDWRVMASIDVGWEKERFYDKRRPWEKGVGREIVRGTLDPLEEQSELAEDFLEMFRRVVLDEPYRLRLRRHSKLFREELARREGAELR
jgi:hypothetical protein